MNKEQAELKRQCGELVEQVRQLKAERDRLRDGESDRIVQLKMERESYAEQYNNKSVNLKAAQEEISRLNDMNRRLGNDIEELKRQNAELYKQAQFVNDSMLEQAAISHATFIADKVLTMIFRSIGMEYNNVIERGINIKRTNTDLAGRWDLLNDDRVQVNISATIRKDFARAMVDFGVVPINFKERALKMNYDAGE